MKRLNNIRKYPDGTGPRPDLSHLKRQEAAERQSAYDKLSTEEKLALLDRRLGPGQGANRQRAKLMAQIEARNNPKPTAATVQPTADNAAQKHGMKAKERRSNERGSGASDER